MIRSRCGSIDRRVIRRVLTACALVWLLFAERTGSTQQSSASGSFTDKAGAVHRWTVNPSHMLIWDGTPYVPSGIRWKPASLANSADDAAAWTEDQADLARIKEHGVRDIIVDPGVSLAVAAPERIQRLLDHLDASGFRYGLAFGEGVRTELRGTVVNPAAYRISNLAAGDEAAWDLAGADSAYFAIADARDGTQILQEGRARVRDGRLLLTADMRVSEGSVAIVYPRKPLDRGLDGSLPDIWEGFDPYRDRLLQVLGKVRFGPGLRFLLDPIGSRIGLPDESDYLIPDSPNWRLEWEAFLSRKYETPAALATAWALVDRDLPDYKTAASLIPLWFRGKGVPFMLDPSSGLRRQISGAESRFWSDFRTCRDESMTYYLHAAADMLKREIADVPVVYTYSAPHLMYNVRSAVGGFDGLGVAAYASGAQLVQGSATAAYSQIQDSARRLWFFASEICDPTGDGGKAGYATEQSLFRDLDWLFSSGLRGVYVRGWRSGADHPLAATLANAPEKLDWLTAYGARMASAGGALDRSGPRTLPYPAAAAGYVHSGPIGNGGVWWVPSLAQGRALDFGSGYAGYTITMPEGETLVIWSVNGVRDTRLSVADPRKVQALTYDGLPIELKANVKDRIARLSIGPEPVLVRTAGQDVFPIEAVEDTLAQLKTLVDRALQDKMPAQDFRYMLDTAEARLKRKDVSVAFEMARQGLAGIVDLMRPYFWVEAEHAAVQTFTEAAPSAGASGGMYLSLDTAAEPPRGGYSFQLPFRVPADDTYTVWLACATPAPTTSSFAWVVDTGETQTSATARPVGETYQAGQLVWLELGRMELKAGSHTFTLRVTNRAAASGAYSFAADALLVTRMPFAPRGTARPAAVLP